MADWAVVCLRAAPRVQFRGLHGDRNWTPSPPSPRTPYPFHPLPVAFVAIPTPSLAVLSPFSPHPHSFTLVKVDLKHNVLYVCHETSTKDQLALIEILPSRQRIPPEFAAVTSMCLMSNTYRRRLSFTVLPRCYRERWPTSTVFPVTAILRWTSSPLTRFHSNYRGIPAVPITA